MVNSQAGDASRKRKAVDSVAASRYTVRKIDEAGSLTTNTQVSRVLATARAHIGILFELFDAWQIVDNHRSQTTPPCSIILGREKRKKDRLDAILLHAHDESRRLRVLVVPLLIDRRNRL